MRQPTTMFCLCLCVMLAACAPPVKRTGAAAPTPAQMAELWIDPGSAPRNRFNAPGGNDAPRPLSDARYDVVGRDTGGFSITYRVRDESGREWNVNITAEDVRWTCDRLQKVSDRQWLDAFRAGNSSEDVTRRHVARIQQKIKQGLELK
jgi:hypothetical protein